MINSQTVVQGQNIVAEQSNWIDQELHESVFQYSSASASASVARAIDPGAKPAH